MKMSFFVRCSFVFILLLCTLLSVKSQNQENESGDRNNQRRNGSGFQKDRLFVGGTLNLAFGNNLTNVGATPFIGYSLTSFLDAGFSIGLDYSSIRDYQAPGDKLRKTIITPGFFGRLFPFKSFFVITQFEMNNISFHYIPGIGSTYTEDRKKLQSQSTLLGAGYASGRDFDEQRSYYYISVLWDVGNDPTSPYKDNLKSSVPIIRAGYNIALFQGRRR